MRQAPHFRRAKPEHAERVARELRAEDRRELEALGHQDVVARLLYALTVKGDSRAIINARGDAVAIIGCAVIGDGVASPWMLCAQDHATARKLMVRHCPRWVRAWAKSMGRLINATYAENRMHHRFIEHCKFKWAGETVINGSSFKVFEYV